MDFGLGYLLYVCHSPGHSLVKKIKLLEMKNKKKLYGFSLGIQIRNSKIDLNIVALSIGCRNKHWSQCFNQILISLTGLISSGPSIVVQAALDSRAACTTTAGPEVVKPVDEIKIWLKHCDQCLFLQPMLSATIFKSFFEFRIWIPNQSNYLY